MLLGGQLALGRPCSRLDRDVMLRRDSVLEVFEDQSPALRKLGVRRLGLLGSFARDEARPESDVDVLVEFDEKTFDHYMDVKILLEDLFARRVDLVLADRLKPALREKILSQVIDVARF